MNTDITNWVFTFMDGVENAAANSVNGKGGGDVATNGTPFWLTVDLKEVKMLQVFRLLTGEEAIVRLKLKSLLRKTVLLGNLWDKLQHQVLIMILHLNTQLQLVT